MEQIFEGQIVDIHNERIFNGKIVVKEGVIQTIQETTDAPDNFILPGFVDAHVHIESSMVLPSNFAKTAVKHGTIATISDPHEIGNVLGVKGVEYMIENASKVNFKFYFGAPSCVPATSFESAGAEINLDDLDYLLKKEEVPYLAEMMNWPGVIYDDPTVLKKIALAQKHKKPVDGHAPGLRGEQAKKYIGAGMSTDHECFTFEEAKEKLEYGMKILIREGSAAKNFEALSPLIHTHFEKMMFCSDDKHPDELLLGHIDQLVKRAVAQGNDVFKVLKMACINPVTHYKVPVGQLKIGDPADFISVNNLTEFKVEQNVINGKIVFDGKESALPQPRIDPINNFNIEAIKTQDIRVLAKSKKVNAIEALDGQLITSTAVAPILVDKEGYAVSNIKEDVLKFVVVNRYEQNPPSIGFIKNFGLKSGAIASSVGHDCHNILAVGTDDAALVKAINKIIENKGGICATNEDAEALLPLPIAGIMSDQPVEQVGLEYKNLDAMAKSMGSNLSAPYMTLSFMALLVIPQLKLSDKGLFDGQKFEFAHLFVQEMEPTEIISDFYKQFAKLNGEGMAQYYKADSTFHDPIFGHLNGNEAASMWKMLIERSRGKLKIDFSTPTEKDGVVCCTWEATYPFSKTGRMVHNVIQAQFKIENGKIVDHKDSFDANLWMTMAFGWKGSLPILKNVILKKVKATSQDLLKKYNN